MSKKMFVFVGFFATLSVFAAPTVTDVVAKQRYPWNGLVDITCKVSGIDESTKGWWLSLSAAFPDSDNTQLLSKFWVIRDGEKTTDLAVQTDGNCRLLWDAKADLGQVRFTNMVVRVVVDRPKVQLWEGGPYWADTNIGAEEPWDYGYYFWWGDTVGYKWENDAWVASDGSSSRFSFSDNKAPTHGKSTSTLQSEGWITSDGVLAPEHDAAQAHWGGNWRMPTKTELENLDSMCTWTWTTTNGVEGYIVRGKDEYASTSIFLPAAGYGYGTWLNRPGWYGLYWSSVPGSDNDGAWSLYSYLGNLYVDYYFDDRYLGQSVRAVQGFTDFAILGAYAGDSAPFFLDTTDEPLVTRPIVYDSSWIGGDSSATVVIADNGTEIKRMTGDGEFAWGPSVPGKRKLTYTTFIDGIAQDEVYEAVVYADWKYTTEDGKATIVETTQTSGDVTIPSEIDGYPVIGIGDGVFKNCDGLTGVTILDCVYGLGKNAFSGCANLKEVSIPIGLKTQVESGDVFTGCSDELEILYRTAEIKNVTAKQRYPWNGKVDITFEVDGNLAAGFAKENLPVLSIIASNRVDGAVYVADATTLSGDTGLAEGVHRVVWDFDAQEIELCSDEVEIYVIYQSDEIEVARGAVSLRLDAQKENPVIAKSLGAVLNYNSSWIGGDSSATVVIIDNGTEIKRATGQGEFTWAPVTIGKHTLTYTTYIDGVAQDEVYEAVVYADWKYTVEDGKATIVETTQTSGNVTIPAEIDGYPVVAIGDGVFVGCDGLTAVTIPFSLATSIRDIFPDSYDKIENLTLTGEAGEFVDGAFDGCTSLKSIVLPDGTEAIPSNAFSGCASLETVVIPDSVLYIGTGVFEGCSSLKTTVDGDFELMSDILIGYTGSASKVVIPDGVRGIAGGVFANRTEINEVEFPSTLEFIGVDAFATCTSLKAIDLPDSVIAVNDGSFRDCTWVQSVKMPKSLKTIGDAAFENCTSLASVGIPAGVASLGVGAFSGCSVLASVTLPGGLAVLDDQVFKNCANLTEITIPASVTQIGSSVFSGCTSLLSVKFVGNAPSVASGSYDGVSASLVTYVPYESTGWDGVATSMALPKYWPSEYENSIAWWNPVHLSVAFDWNYEGGSSEALEQVVDTTYLLPDTDPTRPGAVFAGWWTAQTGGARVTPTSRVMQMQAHTLYAHWKMNEYSVSFDANGGMGTMDPIDMMVDEEKALPTCSFVRVNHVFAGWATEPEGAVVYTDGAQVKNLSYEQGAKVTLYAVWTTREWSASDYLNAAGMSFAFDGDLEWVPDTETSHDGVASLRSGAIGASAAYPDRTASTVKTTVVGAGAGSFWWKVHCEEMDAEYGDWYDYAVFTVDGTEVAKIAGDSGWQKVEYTVTGSGEHTLAWIFTRDDYDEEGAEWENAAWLDEVSWTPNPVTVTFAAGGATGEVPEAMTRYEGCEITLPGTGTLLNDGYIFVGWSDGETVYPAGAVYTLGGEDVTFTAVWELKVWTFGEAVDAEGMTFETGGDTQWFVDTAMGYTNAVSAKSGAVTSGQSSWLQTTVTGAGTLTFRWKVLGGIYRNNPFAYAKVELDGTECASAYLESDWAEVTVTVEGSGDHIIRWTYLRTSSRTVEEGDCAWVDAVTWTPAAGADPIPELPSTATAEEVAAALGGSADANLAANITDAVNYAAYREWAQGVKTADGSAVAGAEAVKNAPNAWLSYALDTEKLIANAPVEGDVTIDTFEDAATDGAFDFTVNVKDIAVGDGALEENIRKVFDIEGAEDLATGTFSADVVEVNAAAAEGGKVKFTVTPKCDENGGLGTSRPTKFFFKVKMK